VSAGADWSRSAGRPVAAAALLVVAAWTGWCAAGRAPVAASLDAEPRGVLDLNRATEAELALLPTIGPARASAIVADRGARGPFGSVDELDRVRGIGPRTVLRVAPLVAADAPPPGER
jgi:competence protein ComEA